MIYTVLRPLTERKVYLYVSLRCTVSHHKDGTLRKFTAWCKAKVSVFFISRSERFGKFINFLSQMPLCKNCNTGSYLCKKYGLKLGGNEF